MAITGLQILQSAEKYKGVPYFEGNPQYPAGKGLDCSGLVQLAMKDLGVNISRTTSSQLADATAKGQVIGTSLSSAQQGDIIHYVGHEEIWVGNNNVFSESTPGTSADTRGKTNWPIIGIVRYADGGAGPVGGTVVNAPTDTTVPGWVSAIVAPFMPIVTFISDIGNPGFWDRVGLAILGAIALMLGIYGIMHKGQTITIDAGTVKKAVSYVGQS